MPQQLPFGFMDPQQALAMNWQQSMRPPSSYDVQSGLMNDQRMADQRAYANQPMASSFLRRFGQPMPEQSQPQQMPPDLLQALLAQQNLQGALVNDNAQAAGTTFMPTMRGGEGLAQYSGGLGGQPWFDEYVRAGEQGVNLPMLQGHAGAQSPEMQAGIAERRQQRLGTPVPMNDRREAVRQQAIAKSEQRASRMGDLSGNQQFFNEAGRFAEGMGGQGGDFLNGVMFGPEYGVGMAAVNQRQQEAQDKLDFAGSPQGMMAASVANGSPMTAQQIQQLRSGVPSPELLLQQSGGDWNKFKTMANASGMSGQQTLDAWARLTGQQMGGPAKPGIFDFLSGLFQGAPSYQHENSQPYPIPYG